MGSSDYKKCTESVRESKQQSIGDQPKLRKENSINYQLNHVVSRVGRRPGEISDHAK